MLEKVVAAVTFLLVFFGASKSNAQSHLTTFKVIAFFTGKNDKAHISFVNEACKWFPVMAAKNHFTYDTTSNWNNLTDSFLHRYQVVIFLDTRPDVLSQRIAFEKYMKQGGAWMGFHFAAFALTPSDFPQDWDWYHTHFLGSGAYVSNTWRPTAAVLKIEDRLHPATKNLPAVFKSAPSEWYRWQNDLQKNKDIKILLSIDASSFPLGTGPKQEEIWHSGYYPVVWTNTRYKMIYFNMGHNDIDYEHQSDKTLSHTFSSKQQNRLIINALLWLGRTKKKI
jgi:uncharacterized protein